MTPPIKIAKGLANNADARLIIRQSRYSLRSRAR